MLLLRLFGLELLLISQIASGFVLLTANIEDVKKIARKFVPENLAEKIVDFIVRASGSSIPNVSEENDKNADNIQQISDNEGNKHKAARQRQEINEQYTKTRPTTTTRVTTPDYIYIEDKKDEKTTKKRPQYMDVPKKKIWEQRPKKHGYVVLGKHSEETHKDYEYYDTPPPRENRLDKLNNHKKRQHLVSMDNEEIQKGTESTAISTVSTQKSTVDSTIGYAERYIFDSSPPPSQKFNSRNKHRFALVKSEEPPSPMLRDFDENPKGIKATISIDIPKDARVVNPGNLTTKKAKEEFDQYDNPNYPKHDLVATSGQVALPKITKQQKWWERALPD